MLKTTTRGCREFLYLQNMHGDKVGLITCWNIEEKRGRPSKNDKPIEIQRGINFAEIDLFILVAFIQSKVFHRGDKRLKS